MSGHVLLDMFKLEQAEKIRKAERERMYVTARRTNQRPSVLKSLLLTLRRS